MSSYADRYTASRERDRDRSSGLREFIDNLPYPLDAFQLAACRAVAQERSVLVAAPTGSGKTSVGEFGAFLALRRGVKLFYTTPIKALSNQKFRNFQDSFGVGNVGLLTGDRSINSDAPIVVMTTEVLRNMLYERSSDLANLHYVVMDEVHYLADRTRGAVWEEVMIHLPEEVRIIALSATVSNAEEFGAWLQDLRGAVDIVLEEHRPVPLTQYVAHEGELLPLLGRDGEQSQDLTSRARRLNAARFDRGAHQRGTRRRVGGTRVARAEIIELLEDAALLPSIYFIFSRAGCDAAMNQCRAAGISLTDSHERLVIRGVIDEMTDILPDSDLAVLGWSEWRDSLEAGIATHHAGLIPLFKEVVERLFQEGLLKLVFATETLALGINMPARSVVIERLVKWNGEQHTNLTAGEFTQLTGRAGRRGLDTSGAAIVPWSDDLDIAALAGLASTRTYPLNSSFRPTYNMAVNLIARVGAEQSVVLLERSFAQFQVEMRLQALSHRAREAERAASDKAAQMRCHLGDFAEYFALRQQLTELEREAARQATGIRRTGVNQRLDELQRGDIIFIDRGRSRGEVVVLEQARNNQDPTPRPTVLGQDKRIRRVSWQDFTNPPEVLGRLKIPAAFSPRQAESRHRLAAALRDRVLTLESTPAVTKSSAGIDAELPHLRQKLRAHPCHGCSDREEHARWARIHADALKEQARLSLVIGQRSGTLGKQFERCVAVLNELGYLEGGDNISVTAQGQVLARTYCDLDLITAESVRLGLLEHLSVAELAGIAAFITFEPRGDHNSSAATRSQTAALREAMNQTYHIWQRVYECEERHLIRTQRPLDAGFVAAASFWAQGGSLADALRLCELAPGDFVRSVRQCIDWIAQLREAVAHSSAVRGIADAAIPAMNRGLVALDNVG